MKTTLYQTAIKRVARFTIITGLAFGAVSLLLFALHLSPLSIAHEMTTGAVSNWMRISHMLSIWAPLLLCSSGLLFTFRAGLWNIGIEGQMVMGAICATAILRLPENTIPPSLLLLLAMTGGLLGGGIWGLFAGILKNRGGVNEIFGGLGLNFVAQGIILWLIFGPWKRAGIASMSGTNLLPRVLWLHSPPGWRVTPVALTLTCLAFILTALILSNTRFGLQLKAVGKNALASRLFGIHPEFVGLAAMMLGGGLAGLAGCLQVVGVYHRLIPAISSGYGYLGLLIVMLAGYRAASVPFIALFFACLAAGSIQLPIVLQIDSSLSGVIQGACVLSALLLHGLQKKRNEQ
ncbi:MAG: ABC transporter permease [Desulfobulbus sp.]|nr:MAG: ABC transporter permease [Desulfobulbus sp.]RUM41924.1 MAG: ABC transporter permease [Desulfobulbus sp.]